MVRKKSIQPNRQTLDAFYGLNPPGLKGRSKTRTHLQNHDRLPSEEWVQVVSSNLQAVRYVLATNSLEIQFIRKPGQTGSSLYAYFAVPWREYWGLMEAPSHGEYHAAHIRWNYPYTALD